MSIKISFTKAQLDSFDKEIKALLKEDVRKVKSVIQGAGLVAESYAAQKAPVDTGRLRQSIRKARKKNGLEVEVYTDVKYAIWQNNGTSKIAGKRFMEKGIAEAAVYIRRKLTKK